MSNKFKNMIYRFCFLLSLLIVVVTSCETATNNAKKNTTSNEKKTPSVTSEPGITKSKTILFFGNSLTAGLGVDPSDSFAGLIEKRIDSLALDYQVINAGISGETTAGGRSRIEWVLEQQKVDVFVLELGGNDALRGTDTEAAFENLQMIIDKVKEKYPDVTIVLAGMEAPPNMGSDYTKAFREIYSRLAKANNLALIPFLLDKVGGVPALNQPDGIHPTEEGHQIVAENIWTVLEAEL